MVDAVSYLREAHIRFVQSFSTSETTLEYLLTAHLKTNGVYWGCCTLAMLGCLEEALDTDEVLQYVQDCYNDDGGYGGNVRLDSHILYTLSALQILALYDRLDLAHPEETTEYLMGLYNADTGCFYGDSWGEIDTRFTYCGVMSLELLGSSDRINVDTVAGYIKSCQNFDGGFGAEPEMESHAGYIFTAVGTLAIIDRLGMIDAVQLGKWLALRQTDCGGLCGRPQKKPDVCYSWWCLSALANINRLHWINQDKLKHFILSCQDPSGGISDRPENMRDMFHTFFGTTGLSLMGYEGISPISPIYALPESVVDRLGLPRHQLASLDSQSP